MLKSLSSKDFSQKSYKNQHYILFSYPCIQFADADRTFLAKYPPVVSDNWLLSVGSSLFIESVQKIKDIKTYFIFQLRPNILSARVLAVLTQRS